MKRAMLVGVLAFGCSAEPKGFEPGQEVVLYAKGAATITVMGKDVASNLETGKSTIEPVYYEAPVGSRAVFLDESRYKAEQAEPMARVRLLEGPDRGEIGWVEMSKIRPARQR